MTTPRLGAGPANVRWRDKEFSAAMRVLMALMLAPDARFSAAQDNDASKLHATVTHEFSVGGIKLKGPWSVFQRHP